MKMNVLVVEDDDHLREALLEATNLAGHRATGVSSAEEAITHLESNPCEILVTDVTLPGCSGLDLLQHCARIDPNIITIVITGFGTIEIAVEAMKLGASDFLVKPFELSTLLGAIQVAQSRVPVKGAANGAGPSGFIIGSPLMQKLFDQVKAIAPFNTTVLITGETGTGKEMIARAIHHESPRAARPLVALNCAAVPEQLLEDELFGHVKGAFTGAQTAREGRFEQADGGTLFLDEIADMSLPLQSKLLRVLQERCFERLGSSRTVKVDVRIVAATSADLDRRIEDGSFRSDLYYRLNVVHLRLPPLRERREAIRPLALQLLADFCGSAGLPQKSIEAGVWEALESYRWPGNVRQLRNAMERAAALSGAMTTIGLNDLPEEVRGGAPSGITPALAMRASPAGGDIPEAGLNFDEIVTEVERDLLLQSLNKSGGNKMRAAKLLNMKRTTFVEKLKRLQIDTDSSEV
ncbi:MAG TPA: sigma-54 dependent transcriptional regulator [Pyrinomonadaceae bacterium]|nr:sigma-54 dependent transcriptional regulator [Pyrinomonadaceae bacterium]